MRPRILVALLWLVLVAPAAAQRTWVRYLAPDRTFTALFPTLPSSTAQTSATALGPLTTHLLECRQRTRSFLMAFTDYPAASMHEVSPRRTLARLSRLPALAFKGKVVATRDLAIQGYPGKEVDFEANGIAGRYRAYIVRRRFYYMAVVVRAGDRQDAQITQFLSSFRLLKR